MADIEQQKPDRRAWGYKFEDDEVVAKIFEDGKRPKGWVDTPAKLKANK